MKELRRYEHVAQREHWCDTCRRYIHPGECYKGIVYANENHKIIVDKQHVNPGCEFPEDPDDSCRKSLEETIRAAA